MMFNKETDIIKLEWVYRIRVRDRDSVSIDYIVKSIRVVDNSAVPREMVGNVIMGAKKHINVWFGVGNILEECCHINDFADEFPQHLI